PVSVMGTGMGIPSCSIYASELVGDYGVTRLIRIGTCGAVRAEIALGEIVLAHGAGTDSNANRLRFRGYDMPALASFRLLDRVARRAAADGVPVRVGTVFSSDLFYHPDPELLPMLERDLLAVGLRAVAVHDQEIAGAVQHDQRVMPDGAAVVHAGAARGEERARRRDRRSRHDDHEAGRAVERHERLAAERVPLQHG